QQALWLGFPFRKQLLQIGPRFSRTGLQVTGAEFTQCVQRIARVDAPLGAALMRFGIPAFLVCTEYFRAFRIDGAAPCCITQQESTDAFAGVDCAPLAVVIAF